MSLLSVFQYDFMLRAFGAGIITAIVAPVIGMFLVTRRYSFMADTLSHVSLAGVAIGALTGLQPIVTAMAASALTALTVEQIRSRTKVLGESALAIFLSGGLALAAVLLSVTSGTNINLSSVLFGSITTVSQNDLVIIGVLGTVVIIILALLFKELTAIALDEELAETGGIPITSINRIFVVLTAVTVSLSIRIVGVLLIGALMVIPVIAAMQWSKSFFRTLLLAIAISLFSVIAGLITSYQFELSTGGTIVLICIAIFSLGAIRKHLLS